MAKLPNDVKDKILGYWQKFGPLYGLTASKGWEMRREAITNMRFMASLIGFNDFAACHDEVFDFFVKKDPDAADFKTFAKKYQGSKDDLLMLPRYGFKSSADIVDCIQWICCFPEIRINIMTGTSPLAEEFVGTIKSKFRNNEDGSPAVGEDGKALLFQILFPEHCEYKMNEKPSWTTPARRTSVVGPTIRATSVQSDSTGTHCDVLKCDDCTNKDNTRTPDGISKVNADINAARKLVAPYGFKLRIGTPYNPNDNLSATVADEERRTEKGLPSKVKVLKRAAITIKPGFEHIAFDELTEEMVELWFPQMLTLDFLKTEYEEHLKSDLTLFWSQYLLEFRRTGMVKFHRDLLVKHTAPQAFLPDIRNGQIFQAWDLAYGVNDGTDFSVGLTGMLLGGRMYVLDMQRGRFNEDQLPRMIAEFAFKWKPLRLAIEDSVGTRWLKSEIYREMSRLQYRGPTVEFMKMGMGTKERGKVNRAKLAVRLLGDGRLVFSNAIPTLDYLYDELEQFPPPRGKKDDIVDALSLLVNTFYREDILEEVARKSEEGISAKDAEWHDLIYGIKKQQQANPLPQIYDSQGEYGELFI